MNGCLVYPNWIEENMENLSQIEFEIGQQYTNEKGVFTVVSIKDDQIVIEFEDGEQISSDIAFQQRIQERRRWEMMAPEKKKKVATAKSRRSSTRKTVKHFAGLQPDVFMNKISSVKWRGRDQLGGGVTSRLSSARFNFNSWSSGRRNEIHWADSNHWKTKNISYPAKFFASADEASFTWGFYIERPDQTGNQSADWDAFIEWLGVDKHEQWIRTVALEEGLEVFDNHKSCFGGLIKPREADWSVEGSSVRKSTDRLSTCINSWHPTAWLDLMIAKRIGKADAIKRGEAIAEDISILFGRLLPLYEAAVSHLY